ncbi:hypothetical protein [Mucilaginibacter dorajii]|uniref:Uncharacterized protein n=1 Tax=Mucilaginibacter dorajii TaxID=692994 RepID=A0ABP7PZA0_9SPHI|nr:hypothetical protein [Mucilaginibacter dorajii]MCS3737210.1 hypothetical protein [Mucilaginibacter dorajii]
MNVQIPAMRGYVNIPRTIYCKFCKICGARPVIEPAADGLYVVKCPNDDGHYQTRSGLIDIDDWNRNNTVNFVSDHDLNQQVSY